MWLWRNTPQIHQRSKTRLSQVQYWFIWIFTSLVTEIFLQDQINLLPCAALQMLGPDLPSLAHEHWPGRFRQVKYLDSSHHFKLWKYNCLCQMLWNNFQDQFSSLRHCATLRMFGLHFSRLQIYPGSFSLNYFAINWLYAGLWCTSSWLSCDPQCVAADMPWPNFDSPFFLSQLWSERSFKMNKNWNQSLSCWLYI